MTDYKKDEPKPYPDWGQLHTPKVPMTIEHYLAAVIYSAAVMKNTGYWHDTAVNIIHDARKAWDLVPEEKENSLIVELRKTCRFCLNLIQDIEYYIPGSVKRYCSTECLKEDKKKK